MKQTSFTLLLSVLMSMVGLQAFAEFDTSYSVVVNGLDYYLDNDNLQAEVKSKSGGGYYTGDIVIPSSITHEAKTYSVTSIGHNAFAGCSGLTSVTIPNSVTSVGSNAFIGSSWYDNQPNGVVYAGLNVYKYKGTMPQNTSITIEQGTVSISPSAFYECYGLTSITIPNSVMRIGGSAFNGCSGLASVTIPNSVTSIGNAAFNGCSGLTSVTIGNGVTSIGQNTFASCSGLTSIIIPNSVTSIGQNAFYGCSSLASVTIGNGVMSIAELAFISCINLQDFYLYAEQLPTTGNFTFYGVNTANATLHVPADMLSAYQTATPWKDFGTIVALTDDDPKPAGMADVRSRMSDVRDAYYDLNGRRLNGEPTQMGIYVHRGRKVVVK